MKKEKLRNNHKKVMLIGGMIILLVITIIFLNNKEQNNILIKDNSNINNTIAMYKSEDGINYSEIQEMPEDNYVINEEKSYCTIDNKTHQDGISLKTIDGNHTISGLKRSSKCYIWFDKKKEKSEETLSKLNITNVNTTTPDFSKTATTDEGVFKVEDGMYGGYSYYWRGAVTNNHVIFADKCWRIIRINGDGSIRLIYNGTVLSGNKCTGNGSNEDSMAIKYQVYNTGYRNSSYAGWTYELDSQRPTGIETNSIAKNKTDSWYDSIIGNNTTYASKVTDGKFCNDRNVKSGQTWVGTGGTIIYYAAYQRLYDNKSPTLSCSTEDMYILNAGVITSDEVSFAGGVYNSDNASYYLYNGQNYWTMSPCFWGSPRVNVFAIYSNGNLSNYNDDTSPSSGLRPVINLRSDIIISSGNGLQSSPYIVQ